MTNSRQPGDDTSVSILKVLWGRQRDGQWGSTGMKSLSLKPRAGFSPTFFKFESRVELLTEHPQGGFDQILSSFGTVDFLLKQSILPVVAWVDGDDTFRRIGTAAVISCSGYLVTAAHVLTDPQERGYGDVSRQGNVLVAGDRLHMGVLIPKHPASGSAGFSFFSFERCWFWGSWTASPLFHEAERFEFLTDIAICKISALPDGAAHQPLSLSLNSFQKMEKAYAFGYGLMDDIPLEAIDGKLTIQAFDQDIYVSVGEVADVFPQNHQQKVVPTPGPCFDFRALIPGKMSGGPILGAQGAVLRGVVSRSSFPNDYAYGAMLGPVMHAPLDGDKTLKDLMDIGTEGIAKIIGGGL
jgi:hypothetical protein